MRQVNMYVDQPSCIELLVQETVRLDRLQPIEPAGYIAEQHGTLLAPGVAQLQLEAGIYHFRTLNDAQLRVIAGGVQVASVQENYIDDIDQPDVGRGHGPCGGRIPALRVEYKADVMSKAPVL